MKSKFSLSEEFEVLAQKRLDECFGDGERLVRELAIGYSLHKDSVDIRLGIAEDVGDIGHSKVFRDFRARLMEACPDVKEVSCMLGDECFPQSHVIFSLKEPATRLARVRASIGV